MNVQLLNKISKFITFILLELSFLYIIFIKIETFNDYIIFTYMAIFGIIILLSIFINKIRNYFPFINSNIKFGITIIILASFCFGKIFISLRNLLCLLLSILSIILIVLGIKFKENNQDLVVDKNKNIKENETNKNKNNNNEKNDYNIDIKLDNKNDKPIF